MLVACLTSLVAINGKNHAGTGIPQLSPFTQPLERAQNDAFGPPMDKGGHIILTGGQAGEGAAERLTYVRPALQSWERRPRSHGRRANEPHRT